MAQTLNMASITVEQFTHEIKEDLIDENYDPIIGIGKSGVGKTMSIYELTQEMGIGFCELRLVTMVETDLLGIPDIVEQGGKRVTTWASNELLPIVERDGPKGILVLDEITSATSTVRAAAYQLLDSKRSLGNYHLPDGWKVVALGNGPDDGGVFNGMESAFLSRAVCYRIEPDLPSWKRWAIKNGVNSSVIAFLSFAPECLHVFDPDALASVFPCPRSWTALGKKLNKREERNGNKMLEIDTAELYAAGAVGEEVSSKFSAFYAYNKETISAEDILSGKASSDISGIESEVMYLIIQSLIKQLGKELKAGARGLGKFDDACVNRAITAIKWIIGIGKVRNDFAILGIQDLVQGVPEMYDMVMLMDDFDTRCPEFLAYAEEKNIIFSAKK